MWARIVASLRSCCKFEDLLQKGEMSCKIQFSYRGASECEPDSLHNLQQFVAWKIFPEHVDFHKMSTFCNAEFAQKCLTGRELWKTGINRSWWGPCNLSRDSWRWQRKLHHVHCCSLPHCSWDIWGYLAYFWIFWDIFEEVTSCSLLCCSLPPSQTLWPDMATPWHCGRRWMTDTVMADKLHRCIALGPLDTRLVLHHKSAQKVQKTNLHSLKKCWNYLKRCF